MKRSLSLLVVGALLATTGLTACTDSTPADPTLDKYLLNGTYRPSIIVDPGTLDPHMSMNMGALELSSLAYDTIVGTDADGQILPQLATTWEVKEFEASFEIRGGITCSDGSKMDAETIAHNINWLGATNNSSPYLGTMVPEGISAVADPDTNTVYVDLTQQFPFLLSALAHVPMVCEAAINERSQLASHTLGSGPYVLSEAVPQDHYTYERRGGYDWGPNGARSDEPGMPKLIVVKVIPYESVGIDQLITGEVNTAASSGGGIEKAVEAGLQAVDVDSIIGNTWFNQAEGRPTAELAVRTGLTKALDYDALTKLITNDQGSRATTMTIVPPVGCHYDAVTSNFPAYDPTGVAATLEQAGYKQLEDGFYARDGQVLTIEFVFDSNLGDAGNAAADKAVEQWLAAGIKVNANSKSTNDITELLFTGGEWDVVWEPINLNYPDQMVGFFSGPGVDENGSNFSGVSNEEYEEHVTEAMSKTGESACDEFAKAEASLIRNIDYLVWAQSPNKIFYDKVEFDYAGRTIATSIRLLK